MTFAISGIVEGYFGWAAEGALAFTHAVVIAVICFAWCKADVSERGIAAPVGSALLCGVLPPLGVPVHFFRTRRIGAALLATAKAIAVLMVSILVYSLTLFVDEYLRS